jgi:hypothetical protein
VNSVFRRISVVALLVALAAAPTAFAQYGGCYQCRLVQYQDGSTSLYCRNTPTLVYGNVNCEVEEFDTDRWYCQSWGETCCMDPI